MAVINGKPYITRLREECAEAYSTIDSSVEQLDALIKYVSSDKFKWPDNDYIHVSTDLLPRLQDLKRTLQTGK